MRAGSASSKNSYRALFLPILFRLMGVEHGTASRWWEELGATGATQPGAELVPRLDLEVSLGVITSEELLLMMTCSREGRFV